MKHPIFAVLAALALITAACGSAPSANTQAPLETHPVATAPVVSETVATEPAATNSAQPASTQAAVQASPAITQPAATTAAGNDPSVTPSTSAPASSGDAVVYHIVPGETTASYEVGETFLDQNRFNLAVGVTPQVTGDITLDVSNPQATQIGPITVDVSQLKSDSSRRDNMIRDRFLASSQFPNVTFTPTQIDGLPASYTEGQEITFKITGDLTVQQTTRPVTFDVTAKVQGDELTGTATTTIKMSDFGVGPISLAILRTEDDVKVTLKLVARP